MVRNMFLLLILVAISSVRTFAQHPILPPPDATRYVAVSEADHDFGNIVYGKEVSYKILIRNVSRDSIKLSHVETSCGCTVPQWKVKKYAPNDTFSIKISFNGYTDGEFKKTVSILFNDSIVKIVRFHGIGMVPKDDNNSNNNGNMGSDETETAYAALDKKYFFGKRMDTFASMMP